MSVIDPKRTFSLADCCHAKGRPDPIPPIANPCCNRMPVRDSRRTPEPLVEAMRRRDFIKVVTGSAIAWPFAARAQQTGRVRRVGVLMHVAKSVPDEQARLTPFVERMRELGWAEGRNLQLDVRWGADDPDRYPRQAAELVALAPDVLIAPTSFTLAPLQRATRSIPIVFMGVIDPVGGGFVSSLARPGGNTTGFVAFEYTIGAKWLELLKEVAPHVTRAAVLRDPSNASGIGQFAAIQAAGTVGIDLSVIDLHEAGGIEQAIAAFATDPNGGLVVTATPFGSNHPDVITSLAARYKLPAVYPFHYFVRVGGLLSYGVDLASQSRLAAAYVDRILRGERPADLPVQAPTKYELTVNLKTAKALGLTVSASLLSRTDEVIE